MSPSAPQTGPIGHAGIQLARGNVHELQRTRRTVGPGAIHSRVGPGNVVLIKGPAGEIREFDGFSRKR